MHTTDSRSQMETQTEFGSRLAAALDAGELIEGISKESESSELSDAFVSDTSDLGLALELHSFCGDDLRYCDALGGWLVWTGTHWERDFTGAVWRRVEEYVRRLLHQAADAPNRDSREQLTERAEALQNVRRVKPVLEWMSKLDGIAVRSDVFDQDLWAFNCLNGVLDLRSGQLRPHRREDLMTMIAPTAFNPDAECPRWLRFMDEIFLGRRPLIDFERRWIGYCLTGSTREQVFAIHHGGGSNGKTTMMTTLQALLGDYAAEVPPEVLLVQDRGSGVPNALAALRGKRMVAAHETESGARLAESRVKAMTGSDPITARFLYREFFTFFPEFKLILSTNHRPRIRGSDHAVWRRIRLVPFEFRAQGSSKDPDLAEKLKTELPGILAWAVLGCSEWRAHGLQAPNEIKAATEDYRTSQDTLGEFISSECVAGPQVQAAARDLYKAYTTWAEDSGERSWSQRALGLALGERGFTKTRGFGGRTFWQGIALASETHEPSEGAESSEAVEPCEPW